MPQQPICEYVNMLDWGMEIAIRVRGVDLPVGSRYTLRLRSRAGHEVAVATAEARPRVTTAGKWTRSVFLFSLSTDDIPDGSCRLELTASAGSPVGVVAPSSGLLASSRLRRVSGRRIQVFPAAGDPAVWIRLGSDTSVGTVLWKIRDVLQDLAFVARTRRFFWVRPARVLSKPLVPAGPVWLIGERPETARDNGRALFAYLRKARPEAAVFYIITADSPMRPSVEALGNVVIHSSWRHQLLMLHADVLANAYSIKHMLPSRWHPGAYMAQATWRIGALRVYLKHGVHLGPYAVKRATGGYDLLATVGPRETQALAATSGYGDELVETGLPRYDALITSSVRNNTILFMPTWRRYLAPKLFSGSDETLLSYQGSTYQRFIDAFLGSARVAELLERHDLTLQVLPHYNLASVLEVPSGLSGRIELLDAATADIPDLLRTCDLLLTDYSSVQFDVAFVGTPVVYCQFDQEEYAVGHGAFSWFEAERDGFGPVAVDVEATIDAITTYAEDSFRREELYDRRAESVFAHRDDHNCARLVAAIDERLASTQQH